MSTATGLAERQIAKPVPSEAPRDFYDPHFPVRQRAKDPSDRKRNEIFDPHFPQRARQ